MLKAKSGSYLTQVSGQPPPPPVTTTLASVKVGVIHTTDPYFKSWNIGKQPVIEAQLNVKNCDVDCGEIGHVCFGYFSHHFCDVSLPLSDLMTSSSLKYNILGVNVHLQQKKAIS